MRARRIECKSLSLSYKIRLREKYKREGEFLFREGIFVKASKNKSAENILQKNQRVLKYWFSMRFSDFFIWFLRIEKIRYTWDTDFLQLEKSA